MSKTALLLIDIQQSFYHRGYVASAETRAFEQRLNALIAGCRQQGILLVDVFHVSAQGPFSRASGLVERMPFLQHQADNTFYKNVHNALTESGLDGWLREQQVTDVIIGGICTEQCCETTARVASDLGYKVTFVTEATMTFPITHNGITLSVADLRHRTESVLINRFAAIHTVESCLQELA
ncbi:cysteine hydrolase family protein [Pantoea sp. B65]|uniref:cysteine hydrolase family protein n=1 Tax=Pantoea sp. B65 TaxID=2813359 RepID=UPI0039B5A480